MTTATDATNCQFSEATIAELVEQHYQLRGKLKSLPGYCDQNLILTTDAGEQYIVKIANSSESKLELDMQNSAMAHLTAKGIKVPHAVANAEQQLLTLVENENENEHQQTFYLRVLSYLPGVFYADANRSSHSPELWSSLGKFVGAVDQGLADFQHPGTFRYLEWDLAQGLGICQTKKHCLNAEQRDLVDHFLNLYQAQTLPMLAQLPQGIIHNDANDYNVLIDDEKLPKV